MNSAIVLIVFIRMTLKCKITSEEEITLYLLNESYLFIDFTSKKKETEIVFGFIDFLFHVVVEQSPQPFYLIRVVLIFQ